MSLQDTLKEMEGTPIRMIVLWERVRFGLVLSFPSGGSYVYDTITLFPERSSSMRGKT